MLMWCNRDCLNCCKPDCDYDGITEEERAAQNEQDTEIRGSRKYGRASIDWKYSHSEKGKEALRRYEQTEKGKARKKKYMQTEKGKAAQKRYATSELGKAAEKRKSQKRIASGKNAEYCRAYYYRRKKEKESLCTN